MFRNIAKHWQHHMYRMRQRGRSLQSGASHRANYSAGRLSGKSTARQLSHQQYTRDHINTFSHRLTRHQTRHAGSRNVNDCNLLNSLFCVLLFHALFHECQLCLFVYCYVRSFVCRTYEPELGGSGLTYRVNVSPVDESGRPTHVSYDTKQNPYVVTFNIHHTGSIGIFGATY